MDNTTPLANVHHKLACLHPLSANHNANKVSNGYSVSILGVKSKRPGIMAINPAANQPAITPQYRFAMKNAGTIANADHKGVKIPTITAEASAELDCVTSHKSPQRTPRAHSPIELATAGI